jgi:HK97 family phage portal protein
VWIIDRLRGEQRTITPNDVWGRAADWGFANTASGASVTVESAMRIGAFWRCVNLLADDISTQPIDVVDSDGSYRRRLAKPQWMRMPDPEDRNITFQRHIAQAIFSILTDGNIFTEAFPSTLPNEVFSLRVRAPEKIKIERDPVKGGVTFVQKNLVQDWRQIVHIPLVVPAGKDRGLNPIDAAREGLGTGLASQEFSNRYFSNGTVMSGIVESPTAMSNEAIEQMRTQFALKKQGVRHSHLLGIITGNATYKQLSATPKDSMLIELWNWVVEDVARYFGIQPYKVGSTSPGAVAYASTSNSRLDYVEGPVLALTRKLEGGYSRLLPDGQQMRVDLNGLKRGDIETRFKVYATGLDKQVYTKDEVRAWEDLSPMDEAISGAGKNGGLLETPNNNAPGAPEPAAPPASRALSPEDEVPTVIVHNHMGESRAQSEPVVVHNHLNTRLEPEQEAELAEHRAAELIAQQRTADGLAAVLDQLAKPVEPPVVNVPAPVVNIAPADVRVMVPSGPAPVVNVTAAPVQDVRIVGLPQLKAKVKRDKAGRIESIEE